MPDSPLSRRAELSAGQPISELMAQALARPELISLAAGFVDQATLPVQPARQALDALLGDPAAARTALQYGTTPGYATLREMLLERVCREDGLDPNGIALEQVVLTAGSNQLLHLLGETLLDPGDVVLCATPTYFVYLGALASIGARARGVASDNLGMIPDALEETLAGFDQQGELARVKAIYLVSYFDNPGGVTMPEERRRRIVEIARRWSRRGRLHVIDDTAYRSLRYEGEDVAGLRSFDEDGNTVILTGTFSKSFSPGIRVGFGILPRHLVEPVANQKGNIDFGSPNFNQHLMAKVLELDLLDDHVARLKEGYRPKLAAMLEALDEHFGGRAGVRWVRPRGGLYVWLELPEPVDAGPRGTLFSTAVEEGMLYVPGEHCFAPEGEPVKRNTIRLSFGVQTPDRIRQGIAALARATKREEAGTKY